MVYDVIIIGAGPAGLSAGLYAARGTLKTLIIEKESIGGQIATTDEVANYPGSIENATGPALAARMVEQAEEFGALRVSDTISSVDLSGKIKLVKGEKTVYETKTLIIATGSSPKRIGCPGEKQFTGKGVGYCATCDAPFFEDLDVYVVGGGDAAVEEAMYLTKFAKKVTIIHRRDALRAAKSIQEKAFKNKKIDFMYDTEIIEIKGEGLLDSMLVKNTKTGDVREILADEDDGTFGIFVFIGYNPATTIFEGLIDMEGGYIITNANMETNIPGVYAAGDNRVKTLRQVVTATADGAIAAIQAEKYIEEFFN